jgi:ABC-2 type transport system ATP-binding protein
MVVSLVNSAATALNFGSLNHGSVSMIEVKDLTKNYGERLAVDHLNFKVKAGEVVGFLGPNGAGKTTTMKIITGYMAPSSGAACVDGLDVFEEPIKVKRRIGYLPEIPPVYEDMEIEPYLRFVAALKGVPPARVTPTVGEALEKTNLSSSRRRLIKNLSKGFKQRVGLAQALVSKPKVLILDEPTVGLDPSQVAEVRQLIRELRGEHTILLSTHVLSEVQAVCERVIIINKGKIVAEDTLQGLAARVQGGQRYRLKVLRQAEALARALREQKFIDGIEVRDHELLLTGRLDPEQVAEVARVAATSGAGLLEFGAENLGLEDIFINITSRGTT